jgi:hypothetical protein
MMIAASATLEQRLLHGYQEQLSRYDRAAELLDRAGSGSDSTGGERWAHALHGLLQEAASIGAAMEEDVASWRQAGQTPGPELRAILERLGVRIQGLSKSIDQRVEELRARQQKLLPEIDGFIHKRRMLQAYVRNG